MMNASLHGQREALVGDHIDVIEYRSGKWSCHGSSVFDVYMQVTRPVSIRTRLRLPKLPQMYTMPTSHHTPHKMSTAYFQERATPAAQNGMAPASPSIGAASRGANALSSRITSVLSASYADLEIRDALETLDTREVQNTAETRRQIRLDVQKEVIQCNGEIVKDFGDVAEVRRAFYDKL